MNKIIIIQSMLKTFELESSKTKEDIQIIAYLKQIKLILQKKEINKNDNDKILKLEKIIERLSTTT